MAPMLADKDKAIFGRFHECACQKQFVDWFHVFGFAFHLRASALSAVKNPRSPT